jgi:hypothetical protein
MWLAEGTPNSNTLLQSLLLLRTISEALLLSSQAVAGNCKHDTAPAPTALTVRMPVVAANC